MPKVTVIIPIYGVEKYIERCAVSLFEQTLSDIEYIFVNDCTKDNSMVILQEVVSRYPNRIKNVRVINMPINSGLPSVRKEGLKYATGEYIAHCDSDDWLDITAYEKLYNCAKYSNSDIVFYDFIKSDGIVQTLVYRDIDTSSKKSVLRDVTKKFCWSLCGALAKRDLYTQKGIVFPICNNGEDFALFSQLLYFAQSFSKLSEPLYYYYTNPNSITNVQTVESFLKRFVELKHNTQLVIDFYNKLQESSRYRDLITCYKLYCRTKLSPITGQKQYYKLWESTYPELSFYKILINPIIPYRTILHYIAVKCRVYHLLHKY